MRKSSSSSSYPRGTSATLAEESSPHLFCFESPKWSEIFRSSESFILTQIFRQTDPAFASILNSIRLGDFPDTALREFQACVGRTFACVDGILPTRIFTHRKEVDDLNRCELESLRGGHLFLDR